MLTKAQAENYLQPYMVAIQETITTGFAYYYERYGDVCHKHQARSRANLVNDHIVDFAKSILTRLAGVKQFTIFGRHLFIIQDKLVLHFKKLDHRKISSNYPTLFALDYNRQLELPGVPPTLPRLIAGFVPSKDWSRIEGIYITCPYGDTIAWDINVTSQHALETIPLQLTKDEQSTVPNRKRVRARGAAKTRDTRKAVG